jgi:hypothetical protein
VPAAASVSEDEQLPAPAHGGPMRPVGRVVTDPGRRRSREAASGPPARSTTPMRHERIATASCPTPGRTTAARAGTRQARTAASARRAASVRAARRSRASRYARGAKGWPGEALAARPARAERGAAAREEHRSRW